MNEIKYNCEIIFENNIKSKKQEFIIECNEVEKDGRYQTIILHPFYCKSAWTQSPTKNLENRALEVLSSALRSKYKSIKLRNYNNIKRFEAFKEIVKNEQLNNLKHEFSHSLNHKDLEDKIGEKKISDIWEELNKLKSTTKISEIPNGEFGLTWDKFVKIIFSKSCSYCGISIDNIYKISQKEKLFTKRARGYCLEVDQIDAYDHYNDNNCVAVCYWCNNAKTDEFTVEEFKEIAKGINAVWKCREADIIKFDDIEFWKDRDKKCQ